jgi:Prolyl oligopeptidase family
VSASRGRGRGTLVRRSRVWPTCLRRLPQQAQPKAGDPRGSVDYLGTLGYVDTDRVGVWGLSYGGFLTLRALIITPTAFRAGIDVSGVTDWEDYARDPGNPWLSARMGTHEDNPKQYEQGARVDQVSQIVRPLLVLGSTADTNVPYEQTVPSDGPPVGAKDIRARPACNCDFVQSKTDISSHKLSAIGVCAIIPFVQSGAAFPLASAISPN